MIVTRNDLGTETDGKQRRVEDVMETELPVLIRNLLRAQRADLDQAWSAPAAILLLSR